MDNVVKIAVVEDEGIVAMDIRRCLLSMGHYVSFISDSGEKAIDKLKQNKADLVLMDIQMPGLNGYEATKAIKRVKKNLPVISPIRP